MDVTELKADRIFSEQLSACENWPNHVYLIRPHGLKDALFLLAEIADGRTMPDELTLRKACALVYADHLRLEGYHYYSEEAKQHKAKKFSDEIREAMKKKSETGRDKS